jgi:hypothetical protein
MQFNRWEDLRFPSQAINPPGGITNPNRSETTAMLEFAGNADNMIAGIAQMPHSWKEESDVTPHLHLMFPTSANADTRWKFEYNRMPLKGYAESGYGNYASLPVITVANPQNVTGHVYTQFASVPMSGCSGSSCMLWRVSRLASSDAADTDTNSCVLLEFDIHYQSDKMGSAYTDPTI